MISRRRGSATPSSWNCDIIFLFATSRCDRSNAEKNAGGFRTEQEGKYFVAEIIKGYNLESRLNMIATIIEEEVLPSIFCSSFLVKGTGKGGTKLPPNFKKVKVYHK